jgi:hypothetical protein
VRASFRETKNADYARRRDPRAGLGRGVRPSPISTELGGRRREPQLTPAGRRRRWSREAAYRTLYTASRSTALAGTTQSESVPLLFALALVGGTLAAVFAPLYLDLFRRELSRADELEKVAARLGLRFSRYDPAYPASTAFRYPFELFSRGIEQTCENFMTGTVAGVDVIAFDFVYRLRHDSGDEPLDGGRSEAIRFSCALAEVEGERPHVVIEPASTSLPARADGEPVRLEWSDFNARYRVISPDRGFASALLDLGLMAWLVDDAPALPLTWEIQREWVLCRAPSLAPFEAAALTTALPEFARRIARGASD